jgi:hypothetical protein
LRLTYMNTFISLSLVSFPLFHIHSLLYLVLDLFSYFILSDMLYSALVDSDFAIFTSNHFSKHKTIIIMIQIKYNCISSEWENNCWISNIYLKRMKKIFVFEKYRFWHFVQTKVSIWFLFADCLKRFKP